LSFLSGLFLIAIPLALLPILLHFYKERKRDVIEWGAMQFLNEAMGEGRRRQALEEIVLMLLRTATVIALILAMAQPTVRGSWLGNHPLREVVLIVDDSLSTSVVEEEISVFDRLRRQAAELIGNLKQHDQVQIMAASCGNRWLTAQSIPASDARRGELLAIVESMQPTEGSTNILDCLNAVLRIKSPPDTVVREIYVFTDCQASTWRADAKDNWRELAELAGKQDPPVNISVVQPDRGLTPSNMAMGPVETSRSLVRKGEQILAKSSVANFGSRKTAPLRVVWSSDGRQIAESQLAPLAVGATVQVTAPLTLEEPGVHVIECRLDNQDSLGMDQRSRTIIEVAERIPILIVDSSADLATDHNRLSPAQLVAATLGYHEGRPQPWHSVFEPRTVSVANLATQNLHDYAAIVVPSLASLSATDVKRLEMYVAAYGGLWIALGPHIDGAQFNSVWHDGGEGLSPAAIGELAIDDADEMSSISVHPPARDHAATAHLSDTSQLDVDKLNISQHWKLQGNRAAKETSVLLESQHGVPLVIEKSYGNGRVIVQSFPVDLEWSNLPVLKSFVVLVHDWLDYLTAPSRSRYNIQPGTPIVARSRAGSESISAKVLTPEGVRRNMSRWRDDDENLHRFTQTALPGLYRVEFSDDPPAALPRLFHVSRDLEESNLTPLTSASRDEIASLAGLQVGNNVKASASVSSIKPHREPLWWILLGLLAALIVFELWLSSRVSRRRWTSAVLLPNAIHSSVS
jgi:hypothetical protein